MCLSYLKRNKDPLSFICFIQLLIFSFASSLLRFVRTLSVDMRLVINQILSFLFCPCSFFRTIFYQLQNYEKKINLAISFSDIFFNHFSAFFPTPGFPSYISKNPPFHRESLCPDTIFRDAIYRV